MEMLQHGQIMEGLGLSCLFFVAIYFYIVAKN